MLKYLIKQSKPILASASLASIVHGIGSVLLLAQISSALTADDPDYGQRAMVFAITALCVMFSYIAAAILFERLGQSVHAELRSFIANKVIAADYRQLELLGAARVQSALSEHCSRVAEFFVSFPVILTNAVVVAGCLVYMALLSWQVFLLAVLVIGFGSLSYHFAYFRSLTDGAKELRLNRGKRNAFYHDVLQQSIEKVSKKRTFGMSVFVASAGWGNFLIYAFIGMVLFILVGDVPERTLIMTGYALVFVYIVGPLETLLLNIPRANLAQVSAERIEEITQAMTSKESPVPIMELPPLQSITLHQVLHRYYHEQKDEMFTLGPIDLQFRPGEITFLVGGNGSGKTTLALSQGQRKRLALAVAYLENRPFLVFDEWAADQGPVFKEIFYRELLPELRAMGKAILVISHDDRYFHLADRLLRMENGRLSIDHFSTDSPEQDTAMPPMIAVNSAV